MRPTGDSRRVTEPLLSRPLVVLTTCALIAAGGVAVLLVKAVMQERSLNAQRLRDGSALAARRLADGIGPELNGLSRALPEDVRPAISVPPAPLTSVPDRVALVVRGDQVEVVAPARLSYRLSSAGQADEAGSARLQQAETLEIRARDFTAAARAYRAIVESAATRSPLGAAARQRLARTLRKAGSVDEALSVLREIVREPPSERSPGIAGAYHDICAVLQETGREDDLRDCALEFRAGLAEGRWDLEKALYEYYSGRVRGWLATSDGAGESPLARQESARLDLTAIAAAALSAWRTAGEEREGHLLLAKPGAATVVAWQREGNDGAALQVLTQAAVRREVLQPLAARLAPDHIVSIWANQAPVLAGSPPKQSPAPRSLHDAPSAMVLVADRTVVWRVTASPLPGTSESGLGMRGGTTLAAVGLMLLSAALAGFFAVRSVRQELEVARLKSEFVSTVSHELRSPLAAISHLSELLDGGRVTDETRKREYYRLIVAETARLRRLVENLLNFARLEEGRQEFRFQPLEAGAWLQATVDAFRDGPAADGREIVLDIAPDLPPVRADAAALGTVVVNLLDNAVKYSPSGTAIRVLLDGADDRIELRVADEGPGIDDADRARVFERFYRGRNAQGVAGTGLGLALVQRIVLAHGGTTRVERGERGTGTAFTVSLPSAEDTTGSARAPVEERR